MYPKNNPYYNGEFERAVREAGVTRAVIIGEALADGVAAVGRLLKAVQSGFTGTRQRPVPLSPRSTAAEPFGSGD